MVFAYWLEDSGVPLEDEKHVNPESDKSVDFATSLDGLSYHIELVRVEHSDKVMHHIDTQAASNELFPTYLLLLSSDHKNEYFRTAAQLIRLQEKILEKVGKFAEPSLHTLSVIVVDCTNIHAGMLDAEDIRIAAYGKARNPVWQEYWSGSRLMGLFEPNYRARNAEELRRKVAAIVFISELKPGVLDKSYFAVNPAFHAAEQLHRLPGFLRLKNVLPAF
jgi:hypothetical protein